MQRNSVTRRQFLREATIAAAALSVGLSVRSWSQVAGANEAIRVGVIGFNSRGQSHIEGFRKLPGVKVVALCDVDQNILAREAQKFADRQETITTFQDIRRLLEDKNIDAVSIATPNHWHALAAIWACQAGKDVYVEKPVSHNVLEGRRVVEAARKYQRIVQAGTQSRSRPGVREVMQLLHEGKFGRARLARGLCYKPRPSIGKVKGEQPIPPGISYDLWLGPAPMKPLRRKNLHYDWHWVYDTGNGDMGNQGIHEMDLCRWALNQTALSPRVMSVGGRFGYDDDGETPNTQFIYHDYDKTPLIFEVRGLPRNKEFQDKAWGGNMDSFPGVSGHKGVGVVVYCEGGNLVIPSESSPILYDPEGRKIKTFESGGNHFATFIKAVRSRKPADLTADILEGHLSSALCHTGMISHRLGKEAVPGDIREQIQALPEAAETFGRFQEHLAANGIQISDTKAVLGPWLKMDPQTELFSGNAAANKLLTREYRAGFVVPEKV